MNMMKTFRIENKISGQDLGVFEGTDEFDVVDVMAQEAGYEDYNHLIHVVGGSRDELIVTEIDHSQP